MSVQAFACTIMFIGDQITRGDGPQPTVDNGTVGFRLPYQQALADEGLTCNFVGDQSDGHGNVNATTAFKPHWQGSDNLFADVLADGIAAKILQYQPDIAIVNTGTYNVLVKLVESVSGTTLQPAAEAAADVMRVVDTIYGARVNTLIVLVIPGTGNPRNASLVGLRTNLLSLLGTRQFLQLVDLSLALRAPDDYIATVLPTREGYERSAIALFGVTELRVRELQPAPAPVPIPPAILLLGPALICVCTKRRRPNA